MRRGLPPSNFGRRPSFGVVSLPSTIGTIALAWILAAAAVDEFSVLGGQLALTPSHADAALLVPAAEDGASKVRRLRANELARDNQGLQWSLRSSGLFATAGHHLSPPSDHFVAATASADRRAATATDRFERARTLMRLEYERISAREASLADATVVPFTGERVGDHLAAQLPTLGSESGLVSAPFSKTASSGNAVPRRSEWTGEALFGCGAALFVLAVASAAVGFVCRRRSRRQSYPCWERELRNGLAASRAL